VFRKEVLSKAEWIYLQRFVAEKVTHEQDCRSVCTYQAVHRCADCVGYTFHGGKCFIFKKNFVILHDNPSGYFDNPSRCYPKGLTSMNVLLHFEVTNTPPARVKFELRMVNDCPRIG